jgi:outer membrane murein-binding lipoprotein Lpp
MSTPPTTQASIEQLHRDVAALAEDMRSPAPTATRAILQTSISESQKPRISAAFLFGGPTRT